MKVIQFKNKKIGGEQSIKPRNLLAIFMSILIGLGSMAVWAEITIDTTLKNIQQNIQRIIISKNGVEDEANRFYDINYDGSGSTMIYYGKMPSERVIDQDEIIGMDWYILGTEKQASGSGNLLLLDKDALASYTVEVMSGTNDLEQYIINVIKATIKPGGIYTK